MPTIDFHDTIRGARNRFTGAVASAFQSEAVPLDLIGDIYDAVLEQTLWPKVLEKAAAFVGGPAASLFSMDAASRSGTLVYDHGIDPHYKRLLLDKYLKLDPTGPGQFLAGIGEPVATGDVIPYDEFTASRFFREWAEPQGLVDFISSVLERSATSMAMFGVFRDRDDGIVDEPARARMRLITPHIRRAVLIGRVIDLGAAKTATLHEVFDGLSAGMFLVDAHARVIHANAAGRAMLTTADFLRAVGGRLVAREAIADRTLKAVFAAAAKGDGAVGLGGIAVPLFSENRESYVAHVLPLGSGAREAIGSSESAAAALFVHKAEMGALAMPETVARHYKLTPTELRVLLSLLDVGSGPEVAEALGVADSTVKTHLGRIYQKTGARGQVDLVKLVAGFASPLVG